MRISSLLPRKENFKQTFLFFLDKQINTVPIGLFLVAPVGPAIPVTLKPKSEFVFLRIFSAISFATLLDTEPYLAIVSAGIPKSTSLLLLL